MNLEAEEYLQELLQQQNELNYQFHKFEIRTRYCSQCGLHYWNDDWKVEEEHIYTCPRGHIIDTIKDFSF